MPLFALVRRVALGACPCDRAFVGATLDALERVFEPALFDWRVRNSRHFSARFGPFVDAKDGPEQVAADAPLWEALIEGTDAGWVVRQELASMLPPHLLSPGADVNDYLLALAEEKGVAHDAKLMKGNV